MKIKIVFMGAFMNLFSACAMFGGDMPVRVVGSVPKIAATTERENCRLSLISANNHEPRSQRDISSDFSTSFVVEAQSRPYYFVARCEDGQAFHSDIVAIGGRSSFNKLIELGELVDGERP